jgi:hypothetical protein
MFVSFSRSFLWIGSENSGIGKMAGLAALGGTSLW